MLPRLIECHCAVGRIESHSEQRKHAGRALGVTDQDLHLGIEVGLRTVEESSNDPVIYEADGSSDLTSDVARLHEPINKPRISPILDVKAGAGPSVLRNT